MTNTQKHLQAMASRILTQDNRITADPIFVVQRRIRTYGMEDGYSDNYTFLDRDDYTPVYFGEDEYYCPECGGIPEESEEPEPVKLTREEFDDETCSLCEGYLDLDQLGVVKVSYKDHWEHHMPFFTEVGAEDYLKINGHNLGKTRIYVKSAFRNAEWNTMRSMLIEMADGACEPEEPAPENEVETVEAKTVESDAYDALIDACATHWINTESGKSPYGLLNELLETAQRWALDPAISREAQTLVDRGYTEAECVDAHLMARDRNMLMGDALKEVRQRRKR